MSLAPNIRILMNACLSKRDSQAQSIFIWYIERYIKTLKGNKDTEWNIINNIKTSEVWLEGNDKESLILSLDETVEQTEAKDSEDKHWAQIVLCAFDKEKLLTASLLA